MSHRLLLVVAFAGIALAAVMPAISEAAAPPGTVIRLVSAGRSTTISEAAIEKKVRTMTDAAARKVTIVILVDGRIVREAPLSDYRDFVLNADRNAVKAIIRSVLPDVESYNADNVPHGSHDPDKAMSKTDSGYAGMSIATLTRYDATLPQQHVRIVRSSQTSYCVESTLHGQTASKNGPSATIALRHC